MADETNPRARLDEALEAMRYPSGLAGDPARITLEATVACAEALSLLVDAHLPTPEPEPAPEPEPVPLEFLPDDTPVGHGWVADRDGRDLFKRESGGFFTRWSRADRKWGPAGHWEKSEMVYTRPATAGDLRREGVPLTDWPDITASEPEPAEPPAGPLLLVGGEAWLRFGGEWLKRSERARSWAALCELGTPTVIYTPKEAP